jgi:hypothetical protein
MNIRYKPATTWRTGDLFFETPSPEVVCFVMMKIVVLRAASPGSPVMDDRDG